MFLESVIFRRNKHPILAHPNYQGTSISAGDQLIGVVLVHDNQTPSADDFLERLANSVEETQFFVKLQSNCLCDKFCVGFGF